MPTPAERERCPSASRLQYGGQEHLDAPPRELLLAQTEDYVEYSRHGAVIKGQEKAIARSKYEEDVLINNHTVSDGNQVIISLDIYIFFLNAFFFAVYLGLVLERRQLGLHVLPLAGQTELLHRRGRPENHGEFRAQSDAGPREYETSQVHEESFTLLSFAEHVVRPVWRRGRRRERGDTKDTFRGTECKY